MLPTVRCWRLVACFLYAVHAAPRHNQGDNLHTEGQGQKHKDLSLQLQSLKETEASHQAPPTDPPQVHTQATNDQATEAPPQSLNLSLSNSATLEFEQTPMDIAQYIFWTGDERSIAWALNDFLQEGIISREDGLKFLEDIRHNLEWLRSRYAPHQSSSAGGGGAGGASDTEESSVGGGGAGDWRFREGSLQEVIYHLAKELFSTPKEGPRERALQRLLSYIQQQHNIPSDLQKSVTDSLVTAYVDTVTGKD